MQAGARESKLQIALLSTELRQAEEAAEEAAARAAAAAEARGREALEAAVSSVLQAKRASASALSLGVLAAAGFRITQSVAIC